MDKGITIHSGHTVQQTLVLDTEMVNQIINIKSVQYPSSLVMMISTIAKANYLSQSWQVLRSLQTPPAWGMSMTHEKNIADLKSNDK